MTSKLSLTDVIPLSLVDRPASLGRGTARRVKQRDGGHCCICGSDMTEVYHLVDKNDLYLHQRAWILERGLNNIIERNCLENLVTRECFYSVPRRLMDDSQVSRSLLPTRQCDPSRSMVPPSDPG